MKLKKFNTFKVKNENKEEIETLENEVKKKQTPKKEPVKLLNWIIY
jgi:hypothetical protein